MGEIRFDFDAAGQASRQTEDIAGRLSKDILPGFQDILQQIDRSLAVRGRRQIPRHCL